MNENLIAQIDREIASHEAAIASLRAARTALHGRLAPAPAPSTPKAVMKPKKVRRRAPNGYLEGKIMDLLRAKPGLTNGEIRDELVKADYQFSVKAPHVSKVLTELAKDKKVVSSVQGIIHRYHVA